MDTRDGSIYSESELKKLFDPVKVERLFEKFESVKRIKPEMKPKSDLDYIKPMALPPTEKQLVRKPPKVGRNEPCPCGSGKKFKKCCLGSVK